MVGTYTGRATGRRRPRPSARRTRAGTRRTRSFELEAYTCSWARRPPASTTLVVRREPMPSTSPDRRPRYNQPVTNGVPPARPRRCRPAPTSTCPGLGAATLTVSNPFSGNDLPAEQRQRLVRVRHERGLRHRLDPRHRNRQLLGQQLQRQHSTVPDAVGERRNAEPVDRYPERQGRHEHGAHELSAESGRGERGPRHVHDHRFVR